MVQAHPGAQRGLPKGSPLFYFITILNIPLIPQHYYKLNFSDQSDQSDQSDVSDKSDKSDKSDWSDWANDDLGLIVQSFCGYMALQQFSKQHLCITLLAYTASYPMGRNCLCSSLYT
ncbi:hypothetical protein [Prevotella ihumii]|uniref:hypothetical protein n=1 Tax=Prevotella ihumii TaxID=1917878 RepID=UPI0011808579|nr:hypothetical protein [Prevotella ihumii]